MLELGVSKKNKIILSDYDYYRDIANRLMMSNFTGFEVDVLEEILCGSITILISKLANTLEVTQQKLFPVLEKLAGTGLFVQKNESIIIDKDTRKYFDFQFLKFDEEFKPGMSFLQSLLRKVPIHVLPSWYSIPRTSNNIFASIVEKYLLTPYIYERYLLELNFSDPVMNNIMTEVLEAPDFKVTSEDLKKKYQLSDEGFQEYMLHLEFNFVCCLCYKKVGDKWEEVIKPFYEWHQYLRFRRDTVPTSIRGIHNIINVRQEPFSFIIDMTNLLERIVATPIPLLPSASDDDYLFPESLIEEFIDQLPGYSSKEADIIEWQLYFSNVAKKLAVIGLAQRHEEMLCSQRHAPYWLNMEVEDKALYLYRHPDNLVFNTGFSEEIDTEKNVRESEKNLDTAVDKGWVTFDDFFRGVTCAIGDVPPVTLRKTGYTWSYVLPQYSEEGKQFIKDVILKRLFESGMVAIGQFQGTDCFILTPFGKETLF